MVPVTDLDSILLPETNHSIILDAHNDLGFTPADYFGLVRTGAFGLGTVVIPLHLNDHRVTDCELLIHLMDSFDNESEIVVGEREAPPMIVRDQNKLLHGRIVIDNLVEVIERFGY